MSVNNKWVQALEPRRLLSAGDLNSPFGTNGVVAQDFGGVVEEPQIAVLGDSLDGGDGSDAASLDDSTLAKDEVLNVETFV